MSCFLLLNFQDFSLNQDITQTIQLHTLLCICCLKKNVPLISLANCKHSSYLHFFSAPELEPSKKVVCYQCHNELKKIELFRRQVQESFKLLSNKMYNSLDVTQITKPVMNLEITKIFNIYLPPTKSSISQQQRVPDPTQNLKKNSQVNIERDTELVEVNDKGDLVSELYGNTEKVLKHQLLPGTKIKAESKDVIEIEIEHFVSGTQDVEAEKKNKVLTVKLTNEELMRERLSLAQSNAYMKYPYKCKHCIIGFNYEENIKDHMQRKHGPKLGSVTCAVCLQVLHPPGSLNAHLYRHFTRYDCAECGERYNTYNDALIHYKRDHEATDLYKCRFCAYTTKYSNRLKCHKVKHHKRYSCKYCGVQMTTALNLRRHLRSGCNKCCTKTEGGDKKCTDCPRSFSQQSNLEDHIKIHKEIKVSDKICNYCKESYKNLNSLLQHMRGHMVMEDNM